jgi:hypothetical protein
MIVALNKLVLNAPNHPVTPLAKEILQQYDKSKPATSQANTGAGNTNTNDPLSTSAIAESAPFAQSNDTVVPNIYKLNLNQTHFSIMMVDGNTVNVNATKTRISDFILKNYSTANLSVNAIVLDAGWQMISISSFRDGKTAMEFYSAISQNEYITSTLKKSDYQLMVISIDNYPIFYREKKYNGYFNFFKKNYQN